ncbi:Sodium/hydrogen exchanger family-domain-containing protein [Blastocladiella britannica]|nr:Sodium/hydrogen exchanger family-domain-containing protein [Blastocladiella britannica]
MSGETANLVEKALVMLGLILLAFNIAGWMKKRELKYFGETAMFITLGAFLLLCLLMGDDVKVEIPSHLTFTNLISGLVTSFVFRVLYEIIGQEPILKDVQLSTSFFYMVLLPPIVFEGGYSIRRMLFFKSLPTIIALSFFGGIFSTVVVAVIMYLATSMLPHSLTLLDSLIFGALISSTDPVSILAMLPKETDRTLYIMIFGESALNDAVAIILYRFFTELAHDEGHLTFGLFLLSVLDSAWVFLGSFMVGIGSAFMFAKLTKHQRLTHDAVTVEVVMLLVFAYSSYLMAEVLELTGIISVFFTGVGMAHYAKPNLTRASVATAKHVLHIFSATSDCFIFMYLGMGLLAFPKATYDPITIVAAVVAIAVGRTHVYFISFFQNMLSRADANVPRIPRDHQVFLWMSGLRGAVAFALAVGLLENPNLSEHARSTIFGTSIIVIVTTVYGLNLLTPLMVKRLDITDAGLMAKVRAAAARSHGVDAHDAPPEEDDEESEDDNGTLAESDIPPGIIGWAYRVDRDRLRPFFTNVVNGHSHADPLHGVKPLAGGGGDVAGGYAQVSDGINLEDLTDGDIVPLTASPGKKDGGATGSVITETIAVARVSDSDPIRTSANVRN